MENTPRTCACCAGDCHSKAKQLERELAAAQAECAKLREERDFARKGCWRRYDDTISLTGEIVMIKNRYEYLTTAVGKLLDAVENIPNHAPTIGCDADYSGINDIDCGCRAYRMTRKAAAAVREVMK